MPAGNLFKLEQCVAALALRWVKTFQQLITATQVPRTFSAQNTHFRSASRSLRSWQACPPACPRLRTTLLVTLLGIPPAVLISRESCREFATIVDAVLGAPRRPAPLACATFLNSKVFGVRSGFRSSADGAQYGWCRFLRLPWPRQPKLPVRSRLGESPSFRSAGFVN